MFRQSEKQEVFITLCPHLPLVGSNANLRPCDVLPSLGLLLLFLPPDGMAVQTAANEANVISFKNINLEIKAEANH